MEQTNEYLITTKTDHKNTVKEINAMLKYIYLDREEYERMPYHSKTIPIKQTAEDAIPRVDTNNDTRRIKRNNFY